jgi:hypothetical protein
MCQYSAKMGLPMIGISCILVAPVVGRINHPGSDFSFSLKVNFSEVWTLEDEQIEKMYAN